jgi:hypothetical protein
VAEDFLDNREEVLEGINENYKLIKTNSKEALIFTEKLKDKLIDLRMKNQELILNAYVMARIDQLSSLLNDLINSTEMIDLIKALKNVKKQALEEVDELINVIDDSNIKAEFSTRVKESKGWIHWKK